MLKGRTNEASIINRGSWCNFADGAWSETRDYLIDQHLEVYTYLPVVIDAYIVIYWDRHPEN